jgi:hypothetical protein
MKKIITAIILLISSTVFAQTKISDLPIATGKGIGLFVPTVQAGSTKKISLDSLFKNATNYADSLKVLTDAGIAGNAANILLKLNKSDTAAMLFPYALKSLLSFDSTVLSSKMVSSFTKNATKDSTILLLNNGTRYAVRDSIGAGAGIGTTDYQTQTASAAQTAFTFTSVPVSYNDYWLDINGMAVQQSFYTTSGNIITFSSGLVLSDKLQFHRVK